MDIKKNNTIILIVAAVIALGVLGWFFMTYIETGDNTAQSNENTNATPPEITRTVPELCQIAATADAALKRCVIADDFLNYYAVGDELYFTSRGSDLLDCAGSTDNTECAYYQTGECTDLSQECSDPVALQGYNQTTVSDVLAGNIDYGPYRIDGQITEVVSCDDCTDASSYVFITSIDGDETLGVISDATLAGRLQADQLYGFIISVPGPVVSSEGGQPSISLNIRMLDAMEVTR